MRKMWQAGLHIDQCVLQTPEEVWELIILCDYVSPSYIRSPLMLMLPKISYQYISSAVSRVDKVPSQSIIVSQSSLMIIIRVHCIIDKYCTFAIIASLIIIALSVFMVGLHLPVLL